ncbi:MAG: exo-alpha-sialidase [Bacteroidetes bacterium]|nr:exo-alpha-sialidase [Bacteroidota bacterium]
MRSVSRIGVSLLIILLSHCALRAGHGPLRYIFRNGQEGYRMYRIPAVAVMPDGRIVAFAEGRQSLFDHGKIDIVMKSSADSGRTWSPLRIVWSEPSGTCGNPAPVLDTRTGHLLLLCTYNNQKVICLSSADQGRTWSAPRDITPQVRPDTWAWYATGPGHSIQVEEGVYQGRLVIACNHTVRGSTEHISHVILSDDDGATWRAGGSVPCAGSDECTVAETPGGTLLLNMRNEQRTLPNRKVAYSRDGGGSWTGCTYDSTLIEPICEGTLCRLHGTSGVMLFCNPAHRTRRRRLTLRVSHDYGSTWSRSVLLHSGPSAYSDLAELPGGNILCIYEAGRLWPYGGIAILSIPAAEVSRP